jgi:hypothetical protein
MTASALEVLESRVVMLETVMAERVTTLEAEIASLKERFAKPPADEVPWWEKTWGMFANDPDYDAAMELGRKYRESLRPKPAKNGVKKKKVGKAAKARKD